MGRESVTRRDVALARLAVTQDAMVSSAQLRELGLTSRSIQVRLGRGTLHRVHHGVYLVGVPRATPRGRLWAAVLACGGPDAAWISHLSAAAEWRLLEHAPWRIDVTTPAGSRSTPALRVHRTRTIDLDRDVTRRHGLPITTPSRTLIEVSPGLPTALLEAATREAAFHGLLDPEEVERLLGTRPAGARAIRAALAKLSRTGPRRTRSELEQAFLAIVDRHHLPAPLVNVRLHGYVVDFLWPEHRLVVETDGRNHLRPLVYENDRRRDAVLQLHGFRVVRFTSLQIDDRPRWVAETARRLLG